MCPKTRIETYTKLCRPGLNDLAYTFQSPTCAFRAKKALFMSKFYVMVLLAALQGAAYADTAPTVEYVKKFSEAPTVEKGSIQTNMVYLPKSLPAPAAGTPVMPTVPASEASEVPGVQPGQPVKTYATLADAAKDGVDPLKPVTQTTTGPVATSASWKRYLTQTNLLAALVVLVALAGGLWINKRRKGN